MDLKMKIDSERVLILLFLVVSGAMFIRTWSFGETAGLFPRLTSGIVLVGSILLLVQDRLPKAIRTFVAEPSSLIQTNKDFGKEFDTDEDKDARAPMMVERELDRPLDPSVFTVAAVGLYVLTSFLFGMLWMSPLFAGLYSRWFKQSWAVTAFLVVLTFVMAYLFMTVLNLPLEEGQLITIPFPLMFGVQ